MRRYSSPNNVEQEQKRRWRRESNSTRKPEPITNVPNNK